MSLYSCWYQIHARSTHCLVAPPLKFPLSWNRHSGSFLPLSQLSFLLFMVEQTGECLVGVAQIPSLWCLSGLPWLHISVYNICSSYSPRWKSPGKCLPRVADDPCCPSRHSRRSPCLARPLLLLFTQSDVFQLGHLSPLLVKPCSTHNDKYSMRRWHGVP